MAHDERNPEELLLDWHLDQLDEPDRQWMEEQLRRNAPLQAKSRQLGLLLQPLDHWAVTPSPSHLADKALRRTVEETAGSSEPARFPLETGGPQRTLFFSLRDIIAVAACLALLVGAVLPGFRSRSQRMLCESHLGSIFQGVRTYQASFAGALPFAGSVPNASWLPTGAQHRPYASNSRHIYLLVKGNYGPGVEDFLCPGDRTAQPMEETDVARHDDFARLSNIGYALLNMAGPNPNLKPTKPIVYIGDTNPLFVNATFNPSVDPEKTNSPAHGGKGQTVLTLDGSAQWVTAPVYGPQRDNLWLAGNIRYYAGIETPTSVDDVQLVPGFPATDPMISRHLAYQRKTH